MRVNHSILYLFFVVIGLVLRRILSSDLGSDAKLYLLAFGAAFIVLTFLSIVCLEGEEEKMWEMHSRIHQGHGGKEKWF